MQSVKTLLRLEEHPDLGLPCLPSAICLKTYDHCNISILHVSEGETMNMCRLA